MNHCVASRRNGRDISTPPALKGRPTFLRRFAAEEVQSGTLSDLPGADILGEGGFTGEILFPVPNQGTGNVLAGEISKNTATPVTVDDGTPGNQANVTQFHNDPCP